MVLLTESGKVMVELSVNNDNDVADLLPCDIKEAPSLNSTTDITIY